MVWQNRICPALCTCGRAVRRHSAHSFWNMPRMWQLWVCCHPLLPWQFCLHWTTSSAFGVRHWTVHIPREKKKGIREWICVGHLLWIRHCTGKITVSFLLVFSISDKVNFIMPILRLMSCKQRGHIICSKPHPVVECDSKTLGTFTMPCQLRKCSGRATLCSFPEQGGGPWDGGFPQKPARAPLPGGPGEH